MRTYFDDNSDIESVTSVESLALSDDPYDSEGEASDSGYQSDTNQCHQLRAIRKAENRNDAKETLISQLQDAEAVSYHEVNQFNDDELGDLGGDGNSVAHLAAQFDHLKLCKKFINRKSPYLTQTNAFQKTFFGLLLQNLQKDNTKTIDYLLLAKNHELLIEMLLTTESAGELAINCGYPPLLTFIAKHINDELTALTADLEETYREALESDNKSRLTLLESYFPAQQFFPNLFAYQETTEYRANAVTALGSMMMAELERIKSAQPYSPTAKMFVYDNQYYSLKDIAHAMRTKLEVDGRQLFYVAIGISQQGYYVTTNYHAPDVFRLEHIFHSDFPFKKLHKTLGLSYGKKTIHAETMLAALRKELKLDDILIISAEGELTESCLFCAVYLGLQRFQVQYHYNIFKNYQIPTDSQKKGALRLLARLDQQVAITTRFHYFGSWNEATHQHDFNPLLTKLVEIIRYVTHSNEIPDNIIKMLNIIFKFIVNNQQESSVNKETKTHVAAKRLGTSEKAIYTRSANYKGKLSTQRVPNTSVTLHDDNQLCVEGSLLASKYPCSPRSTVLVEQVKKYAQESRDKSLRIIYKDGFFIERTPPRKMQPTPTAQSTPSPSAERTLRELSLFAHHQQPECVNLEDKLNSLILSYVGL